MLARLLLQGANLLLLDAPTNDVDPVRRRLLWGQVRALGDDLVARLGLTNLINLTPDPALLAKRDENGRPGGDSHRQQYRRDDRDRQQTERAGRPALCTSTRRDQWRGMSSR